MKHSLLFIMKQWAVGAAVCCALLVFSKIPALALTCEVSPAQIPITMTYHGAKLTITGQSAPNDDLIVKISTAPVDTTMKYKGKAGGLFWMKKGSMEFKGLPVVYLLNTTSDLNRILAEDVRRQELLGYDAMGKAARVEDSNGELAEQKWFDEFIRFKEQEMVYAVHQGTIIRQHGEDRNSFKVVIDWPYQAPPGVYHVDLLAVNNGRVVDRTATSFEVKRTGMAAALSKMAFDQAALYGIMSVVIALAAGFAVGAIFKKGGGSH